MSQRQNTQILALNTSTNKFVPVKVGSQSGADSLSIVWSSDSDVATESTLFSVNGELVDIGLTLDSVGVSVGNLVTNTSDISTETTLSSVDGKLPSVLDTDRFKVVDVQQWASQNIMSSVTITTGTSSTSSSIDLGTLGGDSFHVYLSSVPISSTDLTIDIEQSYDGINYFPDNLPSSIGHDFQHLVYNHVSRYVRFKVTNNDASSTDITIDTGCFS